MRLAPGAMHGRRAGTSIVAWALLSGAAQAQVQVQVQAPAEAAASVTGCVDPRAALVLSSPAAVSRHSARWIAVLARRGRCVTLHQPGHWELIHRSGALVLMRLSPPRPGLPPLFFRIGTAPGAAGADALQRQAEDRPPGMPAATPRPAPAGPGGPPPDGGLEIREQPLPPPLPVLRPAAPLAGAGPPAASPGSPPPPDAHEATAGLRPERPPDASLYWSRGYDLGVAAFVLMLVVLLALLAWLLRALLRPKPGTLEAQPGPVSEAAASPAPRAAGAGALGLRAASVAQIMQLRSGHPREARGQVRAGQAPAGQAPAGDAAAFGCMTDTADTHRRWISLLREAGWQAVIRAPSDRSHADLVVARRDGRVLALRYVPAASALNEEAVEQACVAREREQADLVGIVSDSAPTAGASKLATETGIHLLQAGELPGFIRR